MYEQSVIKMWFIFVLSSTIFSCLGVPSVGPIEAMAYPNTVHRLPDIYWNTSNPIFRIDNTDHIIDVNRNGQTGSEYDQVNIVCPLYDQRTTPNEVETEKFVIYHVSKEEFDNCQIMSPHPRILAQCDKPYSLRYFTISFRPFSPTPGALEFHPGKDYYFISTSSKADLHLRFHGMCRTNNMRIVFKVADKSEHSKTRKDYGANPETTTTTTTTTSSTLGTNEIVFPGDVTKDMDNFVEPNPFLDSEDMETTADEDMKKKKKKKKKKKQKKEKKINNKTDLEDEDRDIPLVVVPAAVPEVHDEDVLMNDNPPTQIRQKEPSLVEKVNNLMKQEASIGSISGSGERLGSNRRLCLLSIALLQAVMLSQLFF